MLSFEQERILSYFKNAIKDKSVRHSYILSGDKGLGKKFLADNVCLAFACEKGDGCGECRSCLAAKKGANPDVIELARQDGKEYPIDVIRELISQIYKKPNGEYKFILFKDAHLLNEKCQNALLKTIEEPPPYAVFMFVCENKLSLLPTVRSRSLMPMLHPWKKDELKKVFTVQNGREYFYDLAGGNPLKLLNMQSGTEYETIREDAISSFLTLCDGTDYDVYKVTDLWLSHKDDMGDMLDCLYLFLRDVMFVSFGNKENLTNTDKLKDIQNTASKIKKETAFAITEILASFISETSKYDNMTMALETLFMHIKEEIND